MCPPCSKLPVPLGCRWSPRPSRPRFFCNSLRDTKILHKCSNLEHSAFPSLNFWTATSHPRRRAAAPVSVTHPCTAHARCTPPHVTNLTTHDDDLNSHLTSLTMITHISDRFMHSIQYIARDMSAHGYANIRLAYSHNAGTMIYVLINHSVCDSR